MNTRIFFTLICLFLVGCAQAVAQPGQDANPPVTVPETDYSNMPNPASAYCEEQGHKLEIRTAEDGSQTGVCVFEDGGECEEWDYFHGECALVSEASSIEPTETPAPFAIDPAEYQGWQTYTHPVYSFSLLLPPNWVADETIGDDPLLGGHLINMHPQDSTQNINLRMTFRRTEETEVLLWPTSVGSGEFVSQGTLEVAEERARVVRFICPTGEVQSIWFHGDDGTNIRRGNLEFGFIYILTNFYCQEGHSLEGDAQRTGLLIVASLRVP